MSNFFQKYGEAIYYGTAATGFSGTAAGAICAAVLIGKGPNADNVEAKIGIALFALMAAASLFAASSFVKWARDEVRKAQKEEVASLTDSGSPSTPAPTSA